MSVPLREKIAVASHVLLNRLRRVEKFPIVLQIEPLFRCNLACAGCGKIQHPEEILRRMLTPEQCFAASAECGAPVVSIAGGEPLIHPQIAEIAQGLLDRGKIVYLCTNAILLEKRLDQFRPDPGFSFNVHLDGDEAHHDTSVQRAGVYRAAVSALRAAKARGFRVTVNCTVFAGHAPEDLHRFFDDMTALGVDGIMTAPGFAYEKAPDQDHFMARRETQALFREVLGPARERGWTFNHSPFYLDFLQGRVDYQCTPWGSPNFGVFGWQRPCYLFSDGYARTFRELMETTDWDRYGTGRHPKCANCMMHCGYEPTAVADGMATAGNVLRSIRSAL